MLEEAPEAQPSQGDDGTSVADGDVADAAPDAPLRPTELVADEDDEPDALGEVVAAAAKEQADTQGGDDAIDQAGLC